MSLRRIWSVEEANSLVPKLNLLVGQQMLRANEIERGFQRLRELKQIAPRDDSQPEASRFESAAKAAAHGGADLEPPSEGSAARVRELEQDLTERVRTYEEAWREVEELGVVVKDPRIGLCDFYGRVDGKLVWLCWRYGEEGVLHYHDLDAGFAGRQPLAGATRKRTLN